MLLPWETVAMAAVRQRLRRLAEESVEELMTETVRHSRVETSAASAATVSMVAAQTAT